MIRLHAAKTPIEKTRSLSAEREKKMLVAFLTALTEDDAETVKECLDGGLNTAYINLIFRDSDDFFENDHINDVFEAVRSEIAEADQKYRKGRPIAGEFDSDEDHGSVILVAVKYLSAKCLRLFKERNLFFNSEPSLISVLDAIPSDADIYNLRQERKLYDVLSVLSEVYDLNPNSYVLGEAVFPKKSPLLVCARHGIPYNGVSSHNVKIMLPLFMLYALNGKTEIFNYMIDAGADLKLPPRFVKYDNYQKQVSVDRSNISIDFTLREIAALSLNWDVITAYQKNGSGFSAREAESLLSIILTANLTADKQTGILQNDEDLNITRMLADSINSSPQETKTKIFDLIYDWLDNQIHKTNKCLSQYLGDFTERQFYNLLVIMQRLDPEEFRNGMALFPIVKQYPIMMLLKDGNYRIPLFLLKYGDPDGLISKKHSSETIAHDIVRELFNTYKEARYTYSSQLWQEYRNEAINLISFLTEVGLDISARNRIGLTAGDLCLRNRDDERLNLLPGQKLPDENKKIFSPQGKAIYKSLSAIEARQKHEAEQTEFEYVHEW